MPVRDDDLTRALRDVAPPVDPSQAYERIVGKRARRRAVRRARLGALGLVAALVVVGSAVVLSRDEQSTRVNTPVAPAPKGWAPISLATDQGYLRGPLTVSHRGEEELVSVTAYDRDGKGAFTYPPSHIVRFDPRTLEVIDRVDLKAEILSIVDGGNGDRFAVTRNPDPEGPETAGVFFKRIAADGTVTSTDLPPGTVVTGPLVPKADGVYLPTRDALLAIAGDGHIESSAPARAQPVASGLTLPQGFEPTIVKASGPRVWVEGTRGGEPTVVIGECCGTGAKVLHVLTLRGGEDTAFAWVTDDTVLATSGGELLRHRVG